MKLTLIIFATLWAMVIAAPSPKGIFGKSKSRKGSKGGSSSGTLHYCNTGWGGNNGCEILGKYTFCCSTVEGGLFVHEKDDAINAGLGACADGGVIMCAS
ncbi:hypothetical protein CKM354_000441000 [Cercospora kikuchii]|uniref:Uncharacterized protein n=1 Tax=Cercospora kikuchii TaxID=84275 RepID=A0A9P3CBE2_9PEZI|nr:uncharacterized protein CKM354_000441000 [Cercospora kikuchii]GIZ41094.1 hypothetical protein CKM354_000441000 [Cercospora kikuchii]